LTLAKKLIKDVLRRDPSHGAAADFANEISVISNGGTKNEYRNSSSRSGSRTERTEYVQ
jgi:hypothetical protein